jgi:hypothetical protein
VQRWRSSHRGDAFARLVTGRRVGEDRPRQRPDPRAGLHRVPGTGLDAARAGSPAVGVAERGAVAGCALPGVLFRVGQPFPTRLVPADRRFADLVRVPVRRLHLRHRGDSERHLGVVRRQLCDPADGRAGIRAAAGVHPVLRAHVLRGGLSVGGDSGGRRCAPGACTRVAGSCAGAVSLRVSWDWP